VSAKNIVSAEELLRKTVPGGHVKRKATNRLGVSQLETAGPSGGGRLIAQPLAQGNQKLLRFCTDFLRGSNEGLTQVDVPFCLLDEVSSLSHMMLVLNEPVRIQNATILSFVFPHARNGRVEKLRDSSIHNDPLPTYQRKEASIDRAKAAHTQKKINISALHGQVAFSPACQ
jgi:hypothetical protein